MRIAHPKRVQHLVLYFNLAAFLCLFGYAYTGLSYFFLSLLGPSFFLTYWLRVHGGFLIRLIPDHPLFNTLFLLTPVTVIYFSLVGFQLKNILNERGRMRLLLLVAFLGFLAYVHFLAFQELSLYWEGSQKL